MARVLVADGDPVERELLRELLAGAGHEALPAADGDEALAIAERARPDAALVALLLPRRDGLTLLLHLHAREPTRVMPVIFVSSEPAADYEPIALGLGARAYIEKPWSADDLLALIPGGRK
jgi:CheY-like chemotaxis protein